MAASQSVDWHAVAKAERYDLLAELQRQLSLPSAKRNEAMRFLEVNRGMLLAAKAKAEELERVERQADAQEWREAARRAARERCGRSQHAARKSAAARTASAPSGPHTWENALELVESLRATGKGPRKSTVSREFAETMQKAHDKRPSDGSAPPA